MIKLCSFSVDRISLNISIFHSTIIMNSVREISRLTTCPSLFRRANFVEDVCKQYYGLPNLDTLQMKIAHINSILHYK